MLISEAARGEGGRLFYEENGKRVYFMEDRFGERGNLMPRDVVSRCIYETGKQVYLDVTFLGEKKIRERIPEIYDLCMKYRGIDISRESIPVVPSVHFFMGGIAVNERHETNVENLYAVGECASIYHGANRLGGNSLLAAVYSGRCVAEAIGDNLGLTEKLIASRDISRHPDFSKDLETEQEKLVRLRRSSSRFSVTYIRDMLAENMKKDLGILRNKEGLEKGIQDIIYYQSIADQLKYDPSEMIYFVYSLQGILALARATLVSALSREESRGAHLRSDFPETSDSFKAATIISYDNGAYRTSLREEE